MTDKEKLECCERIERSAKEIDRLCEKLLRQLSTPTEGQKVHCLKCDCVYPEHHSHPITECPYCGNQDMEQTVYLQKDD